MQEIRPHWSSGTKLVIVLLLIGLGIYLIYRFGAVIKPFILAVILAYVLSPLADWFQRRSRVRRAVAILLAYLVLLLAVAAILMLVIPPLAAQSTGLNLDIQRIISQAETLLDQEYTLARQTINLDAAFRQLIGAVQGLFEPVVSQTLSFAIEVISSLVWVVFILVVSFYLIKDYHLLGQWFEGITPPAYRQDFILLRGEINEIWSSFFRGQIVLALVVATLFTITGLIVGLPFALAMGVLAGLLEFLPSIGHGIWLFIASLLALFAGSTWLPIPNWVFMLIIIGLHLFYQQFDLNYLIPRIIGRRVRLSPLVVILGIVAGALLAGVLGILLAAPTIASARVLGRYIYANLLDLDPFPGSMAARLPPPNPRWWRKTASQRSTDLPPLP
jgi:predicted PurR-regulated permease PerM